MKKEPFLVIKTSTRIVDDISNFPIVIRNYFYSYNRKPISSKNISGKYLHGFCIVTGIGGNFLEVKAFCNSNKWAFKNIYVKKLVYTKSGIPVGKIVHYYLRRVFVVTYESKFSDIFIGQVLCIFDKSYISDSLNLSDPLPYNYRLNVKCRLLKRDYDFYRDVYRYKWIGKRYLF